jgi:hypothetical protein
MLTASGNKIDPEVLGQPSTNNKRSHLRWPRTPNLFRFPDVEGRDSGTVPESEHWDKTRNVHCTNAQDMELEVGWGHRMPPPIQRGREDGGHFPSRKEAEQILLFGNKTSHARR